MGSGGFCLYHVRAGSLGPSRRSSVSAPPLPNVSYKRLMPLCVAAMNIRYPGVHVSNVPCVKTPGIPNLVISDTLCQPIICHSSVRIGSSHALYGPSPTVLSYKYATDSWRSWSTCAFHPRYVFKTLRVRFRVSPIASRLLSGATYLPQ